MAKPALSRANEAKARGGGRIDQLQLVETPNSYHIAPDPFSMKLISLAAPASSAVAGFFARPLVEQLTRLARAGGSESDHQSGKTRGIWFLRSIDWSA